MDNLVISKIKYLDTNTQPQQFKTVNIGTSANKVSYNNIFNNVEEALNYIINVIPPPLDWKSYLDTQIIPRIKQENYNLNPHNVDFFFITDVCWGGKDNSGNPLANNYKNSGEILNYLSKKLNIPLVVFGGNIIENNAGTKDDAITIIEDFFNSFDKKNFYLLSAIGPNDANKTNQSDDNNILSEQELYSLFHKREEQFGNSCGALKDGNNNNYAPYISFYDNVSQKVRFIEFETVSISSRISQLTELISELDNSWTVILFSHDFFCELEAPNNTLNDLENTGLSKTTKANSVLQSLLNLNCNATIACWITGGCNCDYSELCQKTDTENDSKKLWVIATSCDKNVSTNYSPTMIGEDAPSYQCMDYFTIDLQNKKIKAIRIGAVYPEDGPNPKESQPYRQWNYQEDSTTVDEEITS